MNKLLTSVGLAIAVATASLLGGCQLYFGDHNKNDGSQASDPNSTGAGGGSSGSAAGSGTQPGFSCTSDANCAAGCFCADGTCTEAGFCSTDKDCGTGFVCDTARSSCMPEPAATCAGDVTCATASPACPSGQVAMVQNGCFTGTCGDIASCGTTAPTCTALQHEEDCKARSADCAPVFVGRNCTGTTCGVSTDDCTCEAYTYVSCDAATSTQARLLIED